MSIAGHVSRAMLSRYSHVRMESKRRAQDEIAARQSAADERRQKEAEQRQAVVTTESALVQCWPVCGPGVANPEGRQEPKLCSLSPGHSMSSDSQTGKRSGP
jgi:hypothetical protein